MKHIKVLSTETPAEANGTSSWFELKNVIGARPLNEEQRLWIAAEVNNFLNK